MPPTPSSTVVLLHGLGLGRWAMARLARALQREGHRVVNLGYASLRVPLEELATRWLPQQLAAHGVSLESGARVHVVTQSMGAIVLRGWLQHHGTPPLGLNRVVMIAPPNQGSTLVDRIGHGWLFRLLTGVNGRRLGTGPDSYVCSLGPWPAGPELGVIAGDRPATPLLARWTGSPGDGKVRVVDTRLDGMADHLVMPHSHTWIQYRTAVITQAIAFLSTGRFSR